MCVKLLSAIVCSVREFSVHKVRLIMNITTRLLSPPRSYQTPRRSRGAMIIAKAITKVW